MFTRIIIVIDGDWKFLGILHSKPLQELHYEGSGTTTNLHTIINSGTSNIKWMRTIWILGLMEDRSELYMVQSALHDENK